VSVSKVEITLEGRGPCLNSYNWEKHYQVTHVNTGISFVVQTAIARTCAFNMMCGVTSEFYRLEANKTVIEEIRAALYSFFTEHEPIPGVEGPSFSVGELFWCHSSGMKPHIGPHLEHVFDWQSASESSRPTSMFRFDLSPQPVVAPTEGE